MSSADRVAALRVAMGSAGVDAAAIAPTDNMRYLLGHAPHFDERACLLLVTAAGTDAMVVPALNAEEVAAHCPDLDLYRWADDAGPAEALAAALAATGARGARRVAADPEMRADHLLLVQQALPDATAAPATAVMAALREVKDADELAVMRRSAGIADTAMRAALDACASGVTEAEIVDVVERAFARQGSDPAFAIAGSGPNGAFAHHHKSGRELRDGDAVVLDIGGRVEGYASDITRMAHVGEPSERYREVHAIVEAAVTAGLAAVGPGVSCAAVDAAARAVIDDAGYGEYFTHRTGHGLGLTVHETPWIMRGNDEPLRVGMVHSVEPGIYLPGAFGVRLEEIVCVTHDGGERFSQLSRDVHVVA